MICYPEEYIFLVYYRSGCMSDTHGVSVTRDTYNKQIVSVTLVCTHLYLYSLQCMLLLTNTTRWGRQSHEVAAVSDSVTYYIRRAAHTKYVLDLRAQSKCVMTACLFVCCRE